MELKQLEYFRAIVDAGTISGAARDLHMTQPPLSYQIKMLEEELQVPLFLRGKKRITLTEAGKTLYEQAGNLLMLSVLAKREVIKSSQSATLHIGMTPSTVSMMSDHLLHFAKKYPKVRFDVHEGSTFTLKDQLENRIIDLTTLRTPIALNGCETKPLLKESLMAMSIPDSPLLQERSSIPLKELSRQPLILSYRYRKYMLAAFVLFFLTGKAELKVRFLRKNEISECTGYAKNIVSLGMAGFIMQLTNSLVTICCNNVLSVTGGDIYISVMTIISSVRQLVETPIHAINEGTSPILSYNYGARRPARVRKSIAVLAVMILIYTGVMWGSIIMIPEVLIRIFSSDKTLMKDAVPALKQYFAAFIFMDLQYMGQTVFKSLNKKRQAIFFSLLRKVFIVVPLTYLMPYVLHMGTDGVFLAEPVSNVIGGSICFITMLCTVMPELKRMEA